MIFPIPKNTYREGDLKVELLFYLQELIKIPFYEDIFKFLPTSPKTKIQFHKIDPFKPPDEFPQVFEINIAIQDVSNQSIYDDHIDELPS